MRLSGCPGGHGRFCLASTALISQIIVGIKGLGSLPLGFCHLQWWNSSSYIALFSVLHEWEDTVSSFTVYVHLGPKSLLLRMLFKGFWGCRFPSQAHTSTFWTWLLLKSFWSCPKMFKTYQNGWYFKTSEVFFLDCFMLFPQWQYSSFLLTSMQNLHSQWKRSSRLVICQV